MHILQGELEFFLSRKTFLTKRIKRKKLAASLPCIMLKLLKGASEVLSGALVRKRKRQEGRKLGQRETARRRYVPAGRLYAVPERGGKGGAFGA